MNITTRPLSSDECVQLITHAAPPWKQQYFIAVFTGLRISDLLSLSWFPYPPEKVLEIKTGKIKEIVWSDLALAHWETLYNFGSPREKLFIQRDSSSYRKRIQSDCAKLLIPHKHVAFHSLRKSHAVIAYRQGGVLAAKQAMNHTSLATTESYIQRALAFDSAMQYDKIFSGKE